MTQSFQSKSRGMSKRCSRIIVGGLLFVAASIALADRAATAAPAPGSTASVECSARGENSLRISRAREAGATLQRQIEKVNSRKLSVRQAAQEKRLINAVYANSGSAAAIRMDIEAQCMAEKNTLVQALLLAAAAGRLMSDAQADQGASADEDAAGDPESGDPASENKRPVAAQDARKRTCPELRRDLSTVRNQQRAGGSASATAKLNGSRRELEAALRSEGC
jgi:hypothetical protein